MRSAAPPARTFAPSDREGLRHVRPARQRWSNFSRTASRSGPEPVFTVRARKLPTGRCDAPRPTSRSTRSASAPLTAHQEELDALGFSRTASRSGPEPVFTVRARKGPPGHSVRTSWRAGRPGVCTSRSLPTGRCDAPRPTSRSTRSASAPLTSHLPVGRDRLVHTPGRLGQRVGRPARGVPDPPDPRCARRPRPPGRSHRVTGRALASSHSEDRLRPGSSGWRQGSASPDVPAPARRPPFPRGRPSPCPARSATPPAAAPDPHPPL
jgi:hypothetical protein